MDKWSLYHQRLQLQCIKDALSHTIMSSINPFLKSYAWSKFNLSFYDRFICIQSKHSIFSAFIIISQLFVCTRTNWKNLLCLFFIFLLSPVCMVVNAYSFHFLRAKNTLHLCTMKVIGFTQLIRSCGLAHTCLGELHKTPPGIGTLEKSDVEREIQQIF